MVDGLDTDPRSVGRAASPLSQPVRYTLAALVVLGAFDLGRLVASALIEPWLAEAVLGTPTPSSSVSSTWGG
jgi:hypothetical protein